MSILKEELIKEEQHLEYVNKKIEEELSGLNKEVLEKEEKQKEFMKYTWDNRRILDSAELKNLTSENSSEMEMLLAKNKHYKKLKNIKNNPYFASIQFEDEEKNVIDIYIALTYLKENDIDNILYDWRSPICSLFYDYEVGDVEYTTPAGIQTGKLLRKRQYKIEDKKLKRVFDNSININDELLQEVLASDNNDKMKNIVNTIQQEQNSVIRNMKDKNLIVQGIAGSGKTSVALHRIAFLLYKQKNLKSSDILIFSPNNVFTEYISNVLPELGEENTLETTFNDFLIKQIDEYKDIESFINFIARYYTYQEENIELVEYKQSDYIIKDINDYIKDLIKSLEFHNDIEENKNQISKEELTYMFKEKYSKFPLFDRIELIAEKLCERNYEGNLTKVRRYQKLIRESLGIKKDFKTIYKNFYLSKFCKIKLSENQIKKFINKEQINYEDALLFVYIKMVLKSFDVISNIKYVVIDEAQDYSLLEYIIISRLFKFSSFTILGDVNQTINPYYKYKSLEVLKRMFIGTSNYLELNKTYRSSREIIEYTNAILNLKHVSAIRKDQRMPVQIRKNIEDYKKCFIKDINKIRENYKSLAIITKDDNDSRKVYQILKDEFDIKLVTTTDLTFSRDLIVIPAYMAKGLEFDAVIIYNNPKNKYKKNEKYLLYVACTRCQHELYVYN